MPDNPMVIVAAVALCFYVLLTVLAYVAARGIETLRERALLFALFVAALPFVLIAVFYGGLYLLEQLWK